MKKKTKSTYDSYVNTYDRWCSANGHDPENIGSLRAYRDALTESKRSRNYIVQSSHAVSRRYAMTTLTKRARRNASNSSFTVLEMDALNDFARQSFRVDDLAALLTVAFDAPRMRRLADVRKLKKGHPLIREVDDNSPPVFKYLSATAATLDENTSLFNKSYHTYLYRFRKLQRKLFPGTALRSFNALFGSSFL